MITETGYVRVADVIKEKSTDAVNRIYTSLKTYTKNIRTRMKEFTKSKSFYMIYIVVYLLNIIDLLFTDMFGGACIEANPIGLLLMRTRTTVYIHKIFTIGLIILLLYLARNVRVAKAGIWVCFAAYSLLVSWHLFLFFRILLIFIKNGTTPVF